jgi:hypothetical protein
MNYPNNLFVFDGESLGLKAKKQGLWSAAAIHLASGTEAHWEFIPAYVAQQADPAALAVNGLTRAAWDVITITEVEWARRFEAWVRALVPTGRITLVGRNPSFDLRMLTALGERIGGIDGALFLSLFHHRVLDLHGLVQGLALGLGWPFNTEKIDDLYRRLGQAPEPRPHTALGGARHAADALQMMVAEIRRLQDGEERETRKTSELTAEVAQVRELLGEANARVCEMKAQHAAIWKDYEQALALITELKKGAA